MNSTSQQISNGIKVLAKIAGSVMVQIGLFTFIGIVLCLGFTPFILPEVQELLPSGSMPGARAGGAMAILLLVVYFIPPILLLGLFIIGMPLMFILAGKKQGVKAGISKIVHEKSDSVIYFIVQKFTDKMVSNPEWKNSIEKNGITRTVKKYLPGFIRGLTELPWILKKPLAMVFSGIDFAAYIEEAYRSRPDAPLNAPETVQHITQSVAGKLKEKFQPPKGRLLLVLVIVNILVFISVKIFI